VKLTPLRFLPTALAAGTCLAPAVAAQQGEIWNEARVLELVERAREMRQSNVIDPDFRSYRGEAQGYVYFFIDRPDSDQRTLVKTDQVALEVFWQAPNSTSQRIVGLRDRKELPTNIQYHLDHLTVVQDDFGDFIRLGDGDEVERVLHPAGPASESVYDFLLADSLSIRYGGGGEEIRVYEVRVRPKVYDEPGFIGTVFLDRATAAIVRMNFTFTPSSYVDPYLDYIRISIDNSLWEGRFWLPYRQEAELRRELPILDFLAGSIIRGRFVIGSYDFNADLPSSQFFGRRVTSVTPEEREAYAFERGLYDDLDEQGLTPAPSLEEIRTQASQMLQNRYLGGLSPFRLHLGAGSDALRYNRAEGWFVGAGLALRPGGDVVLRTAAGYAEGRGDFSGSISATGGPDPIVPHIEVYWDQVRDIGTGETASTAINTLATALGTEDYLDPYLVRGVRLSFSSRSPTSPRITLRWERHHSATDVVSERPGIDHRPVRSVQDGIMGAVDVSAGVDLPSDGRLALTSTFGRLESSTFGALVAEGSWELSDGDGGWRAELSASGGWVTEDAPPQALYLLGGRGTLPGHAYRNFVGDRFWLLRSEATLPLRAPWLGLRVFGAVGAAYLADRTLPTDWGARDSGGVRASVGAGLAFGWDVLRLDMARGLDGGGWELMFSVAPRFRAWL
jgi:hypothetical protein